MTADLGENRTVRIASYNIRKAVGLDWRRDPHRIVDVISEINADIVVLQEADKRLGQRPGVLPLDRLYAEQNYVLGAMNAGGQSHGWHGNAILYRKKVVSAPETERITLPAREPRGAIAARFQDEGFAVIGTHLALTAGVRRRQIQTLCTRAAHFEMPTVIGGDFNHWGRKLPAGNHPVITPGPSFHASREIAALDRFILCGAIRPTGSFVHKSIAARQASDHLPVVLDFEVVKGSA
ncbi:MAG: endonuclease/exonuclease/phosphatase family protein [Paracoccaceae bacterium]|nr:endonuclease/exonuclease/phosphatase family protein [Paracoccaceae bacterium]